MTLTEMLERSAALYPNKAAIVYRDTAITFAALQALVDKLAIFLTRMGLRKGDRVGLIVEKTPECIIAFLGVARAGGVVFPVDYGQPLGVLRFTMDLLRPSVLIVGELYQQLAASIAPFVPAERIIILGCEAPEGKCRTWDEVLAETTGALPPASPDDVVYLNFTSGSTGMPKGALTSHGNIYWNTISAVEHLGLTHEDVHLCMFPVFVHPHELFARSLYLGGTTVLIDSIYPKSIARALSEHRITCMMAIASIYEALVRSREISAADLHSLRLPESGGMHTPAELVARFRERFGVSIVPVWGSTESTGIAVANTVEAGSYRPDSVGRPCPHYEVQVVGEDGKRLPAGEVGELVLRGPGICSGYFANPEETHKCFRNDGWLFTGDLVRMDAEGLFFFVDRKARMMKVGGMRVFPSEIEKVLKMHPAIADAVVVSITEGLHGEVPKALIVPRAGHQPDKTEIRRFCEQHLAKCKVPRLYEFRTDIPRLPGGKILWREIIGI